VESNPTVLADALLQQQVREGAPQLSAAAPGNDERLLILAPVGQDASAIASVLSAEGFQTHICAGPGECSREIEAGAGALLLTEEALEMAQISDLLGTLGSQPAWSELPVIILTSGGESRLRRLLDVTAAAARAATLLERPISTGTLVGSVQVALSSRRRQYQVHRLLEEQRRSHQQLQQSEERMRRTLDSISDGFCVTDQAGRFTQFNDAARRMYAAQGINVDALIGKRVLDEILPDARGTDLERAWRRTMTERVPAAVETFYEPWQRWLHMRNYPTPDGGVATFFQDITERKQADEKLRDLFDEQQRRQSELEEAKRRADAELAERRLAETALGKWAAEPLPYERRSWSGRYRLAFVAAALAVCLRFVLDPWTGKEVPLITLYGMIAITMWIAGTGPAVFAALTGYLACDWLFIEPRHNLDLNLLGLARFGLYAFSVIPIIGFGLLLRRAQRHAHASARVAVKRQEQLLGEMEERKQAEEAQARLAAIVTSSSDAIVSKTLDGIVATWNAGAERMYGYSAQEMIGQPILRLIPPDLRAEEELNLARIRRGEQVESYETVRLAKDGHRFAVSLTISPIRDHTGRLIGASKIARDITERRAAEEKLRLAKEQAETASRAKDEFLAALSHELRTPLTPVLMTAAVLREDGTLPAEVREQLGMIERNVALEARLIDDLLDLTRISRGRLALRPESCDVHSLINLVVEIVRHDAREKRIDIALDLAAERNTLVGDPARLQQVFWNLLRNAVKFTPAGGHIRISSRNGVSGDNGEEPSIRVQVSDNGIGMDGEALERIFKPFEQAVSSQHHGHGGLGLGLAIAQAIVDLHRGAIHAESPGLEQGSTFTVELPGVTAAPADAPGSRHGTDAVRATSTPTERSMRLLVVEDHEPTLQVLTRLLTIAGHHVITATSIASARAAAASHQFDALVSDLGLPDGTGTELMQELRTTHGLRGIVLSGYGMEEDLHRSREAGFLAHLVKPVDLNELRRALRLLASDHPAKAD
jgi:PAS domain S-box-containing protein